MDFEKRKNLFEYIENNFINLIINSDNTNQKETIEYNQVTNEVKIQTEVVGTQYENRSEKIEFLNVGDNINLIREPNNEYNTNNISVRNLNNESLGNINSKINNVISPVLDSCDLSITSAKVKSVVPLSKRNKKCKKAILFIEIILKLKKLVLNKKNGSIVCLLGGDHSNIWVQKLNIIKTDIPFESAKKLFELHNRFCNEYTDVLENNVDYSYIGLNYLVDEVKYFRDNLKSKMDYSLTYDKEIDTNEFGTYVIEMSKKHPDRYNDLYKYIEEFGEFYKNVKLDDIFKKHMIESEDYYWIDECRVSRKKFESETIYGFYHWYEIIELYDPEIDLPFDMNDEEIITIFGFKKFSEFADLFYGC